VHVVTHIEQIVKSGPASLFAGILAGMHFISNSCAMDWYPREEPTALADVQDGGGGWLGLFSVDRSLWGLQIAGNRL
jgi:hypothetical protein